MRYYFIGERPKLDSVASSCRSSVSPASLLGAPPRHVPRPEQEANDLKHHHRRRGPCGRALMIVFMIVFSDQRFHTRRKRRANERLISLRLRSPHLRSLYFFALSTCACSFEVTVTSVSLPPCVWHRGPFNANHRLSHNRTNGGGGAQQGAGLVGSPRRQRRDAPRDACMSKISAKSVERERGEPLFFL